MGLQISLLLKVNTSRMDDMFERKRLDSCLSPHDKAVDGLGFQLPVSAQNSNETTSWAKHVLRN